MKDSAEVIWDRAEESLRGVEAMVQADPSGAVSRSYYVAFYAASAVFAREKRWFTKHTQLRAAVHRDLVHTGRWTEEIGRCFDRLLEWRGTSDYDFGNRYTEEEAQEAIQRARTVMAAAAALLAE